ncbi:MAG: hypothetical protein EOP06_21395 [Proteobacteria bacterium]|nr:MAG: hypothetical protein EOP06_21395 [Pseudomonadota bacterium]
MAKSNVAGAIAFILDRRRRELADSLAKELGFFQTEDFAEDLIKTAIQNPQAAEEFLFGSLRRQSLNRDSTEEAKKEKAA